MTGAKVEDVGNLLQIGHVQNLLDKLQGLILRAATDATLGRSGGRLLVAIERYDTGRNASALSTLAPPFCRLVTASLRAAIDNSMNRGLLPHGDCRL